MRPANLCAACGQDFHSVSAFDEHRVGKYPQSGPAGYTDRVAEELIQATELWRSEPVFGRRCLSPVEMEQRGMQRDRSGRWRLPVRGTPPWKVDVAAEKRRKPQPRLAPPPRPLPRRKRDTSPRSQA
jgi:hypothetical protein